MITKRNVLCWSGGTGKLGQYIMLEWVSSKGFYYQEGSILLSGEMREWMEDAVTSLLSRLEQFKIKHGINE
jgi:hypothetical protein